MKRIEFTKYKKPTLLEKIKNIFNKKEKDKHSIKKIRIGKLYKGRR